jgi:hypothetical protein
LYGRHFLRFFNKYTKPTLYVLIAFSVIAGVLALVSYLRYRNEGKSSGDVPLTTSKQHAN